MDIEKAMSEVKKMEIDPNLKKAVCEGANIIFRPDVRKAAINEATEAAKAFFAKKYRTILAECAQQGEQIEKLSDTYILATPLTEAALSKMVSYHSEKGFIIISACREKFLPRENVIRTRQLRDYIIKSGFSYIPVYGGYNENPENLLVFANEASFIVFPYDTANKDVPYKQLCDWAREAIQPTDEQKAKADEETRQNEETAQPGVTPKRVSPNDVLTLKTNGHFGQTSFLSKPPSDNFKAEYINQKGGVDDSFDGISLNRLTEAYTSFIKRKPEETDPSKLSKTRKEFSFNNTPNKPNPKPEWFDPDHPLDWMAKAESAMYLPAFSCSISESVTRRRKNEIIGYSNCEYHSPTVCIMII